MPLTLLFGVHAHQPLGARESALADAHERCYRPFLAIADAFPAFRFSAHFSGPLLTWMQARQPEDFTRLVGLNRRRQMELLASGDYAPALAAIPHRDRVGQLRSGHEKLGRWTGRVPEGAWPTPGIWEASVLPALVESGLRYAPVDDEFFAGSGRAPEELDGFFSSEEDGARLDLFPTCGELRQLLREATPAAAVAWLEARADTGRQTAIHFDALESFGERSAWLADFIAGVLASKRIETACYGDFHNSRDSRGVVYLRSGNWRTALAHAPGANWLHKRMLRLSARLSALPRQPQELADLLYRAQTHDVYAPAPAGGLEWPHLRQAAWQSLLRLETRLDRRDRRPTMESGDFDLDGHRETLAHDAEWQLAVRDEGTAAAHEMSRYDLAHNFADTPAGPIWIDSLNGKPLTDYQPSGPLAFARPGIAKRYILIGDLISLQWRIDGLAGKTFATTLNLALPSGDTASGGFVSNEDDSRHGFGATFDQADATLLTLADDLLGGRLCIAWNEGARVVAGPVCSIARSPAGSEKIMQSVQIRLEWDIPVAEFTIALQVTAERQPRTGGTPAK